MSARVGVSRSDPKADPAQATVDEPLRPLMLRLTQLFNLTGHPAMSLPCGDTSEGLPCGFQLAGKHHATPELLAIALACEPLVTPHPPRCAGDS